MRVLLRKNGGGGDEWTDEDIYEKLKASEPAYTPLAAFMDILDGLLPVESQTLLLLIRLLRSAEVARPVARRQG